MRDSTDENKMADEVKFRKYGNRFQSETIQQCGYINCTMAVVMLLGGAVLETLSFAKLYGEYNFLDGKPYTFIAYSGYWCGALVSFDLMCSK